MGTTPTITANANGTINSALGGSAGLTKTGSGALTLTGSNTYSGATTISAGTLQVGNGSSTNGSIAGNVTLSGGALKYNYNNYVFSSNGIALSADSTIGNVGAGQVNLGGTLYGNGHTLTVDNGSSSANLFFNQPFGSALGQVDIVHGIAAEDSNGGMPLQGAAIVVSNGAAFGTYTSPTVNNNFTLNGGAGPGSNGAIDNLGGGTAVYTGTINLNGGNSSIGAVSGDIMISGQVMGTGALTKIGTGTQVLAGSNTYTGATTVSSGTLIVANPLALQNSTVNMSSSGALNFAAGITSPTLGGLAGAGNIVLSTAASEAVTLNVGNNGQGRDLQRQPERRGRPPEHRPSHAEWFGSKHLQRADADRWRCACPEHGQPGHAGQSHQSQLAACLGRRHACAHRQGHGHEFADLQRHDGQCRGVGRDRCQQRR